MWNLSREATVKEREQDGEMATMSIRNSSIDTNREVEVLDEHIKELEEQLKNVSFVSCFFKKKWQASSVLAEIRVVHWTRGTQKGGAQLENVFVFPLWAHVRFVSTDFCFCCLDFKTAPNVAIEIENVERLRRQLKKDNKELEMWKKTCEMLENGQRLNRMYEGAMQQLLAESNEENESEMIDEKAVTKEIILSNFETLLHDRKELLKATEKMLLNDHDETPVDERYTFCTEDQDVAENAGKENEISEEEVTFQFHIGVKTPESKAEDSCSSSNTLSVRSRSENRKQRSRSWDYTRGSSGSLLKGNTKNRSLSSRASTSRTRRTDTWVSGREILVGDQPWGGVMRRGLTWCGGSERSRSPRQTMSRQEKRENRERPWALSKEKKAIIREAAFPDFKIPRAKSAVLAAKHGSVSPYKSDFSPRVTTKSRTGKREVSFCLEDSNGTDLQVTPRESVLWGSSDTPLTLYNVKFDSNARGYSGATQAPSERRRGLHKFRTEAWTNTRSSVKDDNSEKRMQNAEVDEARCGQFIPENFVKRQGDGYRSGTRRNGSFTSRSYDSTRNRPHSTAHSLQGPTVWQIKPQQARPHTRGNPLESSTRENYRPKRY